MVVKLKKYLPFVIPVIILISVYAYLSKETAIKRENTLLVYAYSSFTSDWGAGPELKKLFLARTGKNLEFVDVGEAGLIAQRILLEKDKDSADVVVGFDQFQTNPKVLDLLVKPTEYNWSPMTFSYRKSKNLKLPRTLNDFVSPEFKGKIILFDPTTSAPGYVFFQWIIDVYGKDGAKAYLKALRKNVLAIPPSWSAGYGLFKKDIGQFVFTYTTSPMYHWIEEKNFDFQSVKLDEEIPVHKEYVSILKSSKQKSLAQHFINILLSPEGQAILMRKNYMLPVVPNITTGTEFEKASAFKLRKSNVDISREDVLEVWKETLW